MKTYTKQPVHPGRILRETVLPEAQITLAEAATALGEPIPVLQSILAEQTPLTAVLCLKIARLFDSSPELWIRLQAKYDLQKAMLDESLTPILENIVPTPRRTRAVA